ncbi:MAG: hypothetical protein IPN34_14940 [Planctomycetes bacterium]|nr:hypothetical protein [Planctomycetota bacterium]
MPLRYLVCTALCWSAIFTNGFAQRVWVVATQPGPGVDFTDIQAAVTAAADGDVVLVRAGTYSAFAIRQKSLVVEGDGPGAVSLGFTANLAISDIDVSRSVVVRHIDVISSSFAPLLVTNCAGTVSVEDCRFLAVFAQSATPGAYIAGSARTALVRCELRGDAVRSFEVGLRVSGSTVHLHGCRINGSSPMTSAASGADGCDLRSSALYATGTTFAGGDGSAAPSAPFCIPPGNGGNALFLDAASSAVLLDCALLPGQPGLPGTCPPAQPGAPIAGTGSATFPLGQTGRLDASSTVRAGGSWSIALQGPASATAFLLLGVRSAPAFLADCGGTVHPDLSGPIVVVGAFLPPSGTLAFSFPVPASLPALGLPLVAQIFFATAGTGCTVGEPSFPLFLDSRF